MRVHEVVKQCVNAIALVASNRPHRLLAHGALVRVSRRLVVMRIWDQASANSQYSKWFDLQVGRFGGDIRFINCYEAVVFLIDVKVFYKTVVNKIHKVSKSRGKFLHVFVSHA